MHSYYIANAKDEIKYSYQGLSDSELETMIQRNISFDLSDGEDDNDDFNENENASESEIENENNEGEDKDEISTRGKMKMKFQMKKSSLQQLK